MMREPAQSVGWMAQVGTVRAWSTRPTAVTASPPIRAGTYLAWFRAVAKTYPHKPPADILADLVELTPGHEGKWFAAAKDAGLLDEAITLANRTPCDPRTLTRAARAFAEKNPALRKKPADWPSLSAEQHGATPRPPPRVTKRAREPRDHERVPVPRAHRARPEFVLAPWS